MARHPYLPRSLRRRIAGMPRLERALWAFEAALVAALWGVLRLLGPDRSVRAMRAVFSRIGPRLSKSRNIRDNLAIMFPDRSPEQRAALERETWGQVGANFADYAHIDRIFGEPERVEIVRASARRVLRQRSSGGIRVRAPREPHAHHARPASAWVGLKRRSTSATRIRSWTA